MTCFSFFVEWIVNFLYSASCKHFRALYTIIEFCSTESTVSVSKLQCAAPSNGFFSFFSTPLKQPKTEREQKVKRKLALGQLVHNRRNHQKGILSKNVDAADSSTKESEVISLKMFQLFWLICNYHFIDWLKRFHVLQCLSPVIHHRWLFDWLNLEPLRKIYIINVCFEEVRKTCWNLKSFPPNLVFINSWAIQITEAQGMNQTLMGVLWNTPKVKTW